MVNPDGVFSAPFVDLLLIRDYTARLLRVLYTLLDGMVLNTVSPMLDVVMFL